MFVFAPRRAASWAPRGVTSYLSGTAFRGPRISLVRAQARGPERLGERSTIVGIGVAAPAVPPSTDACRHRNRFLLSVLRKAWWCRCMLVNNKLAGLMLV
ncbi:hypothetical protein MRX96_034220 [Rhipicephalus microplus]